MTEKSGALQDDEIDLVDLALALWRRRGLMLTTFTIIVVLGVLWALMRPAPVSSKASFQPLALQVGWARTGSADVHREGSPQKTARWLLEQIYVPQAVKHFQAKHPGHDLSVSLDNPGDTNIVLIKCRGKDTHHGARDCLAVTGAALKAFKSANVALPSNSQFRMKLRTLHIHVSAHDITHHHTSSAVIIGLSIVLGVFCAFLMVMLANLLEQVRRRAAEIKSSEG